MYFYIFLSENVFRDQIVGEHAFCFFLDSPTGEFLRADSCNFRESGDTREILDFLYFAQTTPMVSYFQK